MVFVVQSIIHRAPDGDVHDLYGREIQKAARRRQQLEKPGCRDLGGYEHPLYGFDFRARVCLRQLTSGAEQACEHPPTTPTAPAPCGLRGGSATMRAGESLPYGRNSTVTTSATMVT